MPTFQRASQHSGELALLSRPSLPACATGVRWLQLGGLPIHPEPRVLQIRSILRRRLVGNLKNEPNKFPQRKPPVGWSMVIFAGLPEMWKPTAHPVFIMGFPPKTRPQIPKPKAFAFSRCGLAPRLRDPAASCWPRLRRVPVASKRLVSFWLSAKYYEFY